MMTQNTTPTTGREPTVRTYLSVAEAGRVLGLTPAAVRMMERRGSLRPAARTEGGVRLFRRVDVEALGRRRRRTLPRGGEQEV